MKLSGFLTSHLQLVRATCSMAVPLHDVASAEPEDFKPRKEGAFDVDSRCCTL